MIYSDDLFHGGPTKSPLIKRDTPGKRIGQFLTDLFQFVCQASQIPSIFILFWVKFKVLTKSL